MFSLVCVILFMGESGEGAHPPPISQVRLVRDLTHPSPPPPPPPPTDQVGGGLPCSAPTLASPKDKQERAPSHLS